MAILDSTRSFGLSGPFASIARLFGILADWNDARVTRKSLSRLTARELDDIGLCRGDIDLIASRTPR